MKKLIALSLIVCQTIIGYAQEFPLKSSKWHYSNTGGMAPKDVYLEIIQYEKDTVVFGVAAGKLSKSTVIYLNNNLSDNLVFYYRNDSVFAIDQTANTWGLLYDFTAKSGDTIILTNFESPTSSAYEIIIDSVIPILYDTVSINRFYNHPTDNSWGFLNGYYEERIGATNFFPFYDEGIIPEHDYVRCYMDSTISINNSTISCNEGNPFGVEEFNGRTEISIYPNPTKGDLIIETSLNGFYTVDIYNILGSKILTIDFNGKYFEMDLSTFESGLYFVQLSSDKNLDSISKKLTIE